MITRIHLTNFKGFKEQQTIELRPITLLFGPNSGGKSTVTQAIHYLREILDRKNLNPDRTVAGGEAIDLGGFEKMVKNHDLSLPIILRFDIDLVKIDLPVFFDGADDFMAYQQAAWDERRISITISIQGL
jgi:AAA15 family ATPase/GTPase